MASARAASLRQADVDDDVFVEGAHSLDVDGLIHALPEIVGLHVAAEPAVSGVVGVYLVVFVGVDVDRAAAGEVLGRDRHAVRAGGVVAGAGRTVGIGCGSWSCTATPREDSA